MGNPKDVDAVIDSQAKVIGVQNVRVVDASMFPFVPPGHPTALICKLLVLVISESKAPSSY